MTDSELGRVGAGGGKRERLVAAAARLFHQQGIEPTTLAVVAGAAEVPVGNVYYYFKTKEDLVQAVARARAEALGAATASLEGAGSAQARLHQLVAVLLGQRELLVLHGCPYGLLATDLARRGGDDSGALLRELIDWTGEQFEALGRRDAHQLAIELVGAYQGSALLAHVLGDPDVLVGEAERLGRWIDHLASAGAPQAHQLGTAPT